MKIAIMYLTSTQPGYSLAVATAPDDPLRRNTLPAPVGLGYDDHTDRWLHSSDVTDTQSQTHFPVAPVHTGSTP